jgi:hypothetical protein
VSRDRKEKQGKTKVLSLTKGGDPNVSRDRKETQRQRRIRTTPKDKGRLRSWLSLTKGGFPNVSRDRKEQQTLRQTERPRLRQRQTQRPREDSGLESYEGGRPQRVSRPKR